MDITDDEKEEQEDDESSYHADLIDPAPTLERRFAESPVTSNNNPAHARAYSPGSLGNEVSTHIKRNSRGSTHTTWARLL